jgi:hypothetical protein
LEKNSSVDTAGLVASAVAEPTIAEPNHSNVAIAGL